MNTPRQNPPLTVCGALSRILPKWLIPLLLVALGPGRIFAQHWQLELSTGFTLRHQQLAGLVGARKDSLELVARGKSLSIPIRNIERIRYLPYRRLALAGGLIGFGLGFYTYGQDWMNLDIDGSRKESDDFFRGFETELWAIGAGTTVVYFLKGVLGGTIYGAAGSAIGGTLRLTERRLWRDHDYDLSQMSILEKAILLDTLCRTDPAISAPASMH